MKYGTTTYTPATGITDPTATPPATYDELTFTPADNDTKTGFQLKLDMVRLGWTTGETITITYTAKVNEAATDGDNAINNQAGLTYSNDPSNTSSTETMEDPPVVTLHVYDIKIDKYDGTSYTTTPTYDPATGELPRTGDNAVPRLSGAKFVLYKLDGTDKKYYKYDDTTQTVSWENAISNATVKTTGTDGTVSFIGLAAGTYYILETEAPAGYNHLTEPITVTVGPSGNTYPDLYQPVENKKGTELPGVGGIGTTIFYIIGGLLMVGAAVLLVVRKKMSVTE